MGATLFHALICYPFAPFPSATFYYPPCGEIINNTVESRGQLKIRTPGEFSKFGLWVYNQFPFAPLDSIAATSRKNSANGNSTVSLASVPTWGESLDTTHVDVVASGDFVGLRVAIQNDEEYFIIHGVFGAFTAYGEHTALYSAAGGDLLSEATSYVALSGPIRNDSVVEARCQVCTRAAGTLKNLSTYVNSNPCASASTIKSRINGSDGNLIATIPATTTGWFEDTTHSDTLSSSSLVCWRIDTSSSSNLVIDNINCAISHTGNPPTSDVFAGWSNLYIYASSKSLPIAGRAGTHIETVSFPSGAYVKHGFAGTITRLRAYVDANALAQGTSLTVRINANLGNNTISFPAATTGFFEDTTHSDSFTATDRVDLYFSGYASGTDKITFSYTAVTETLPTISRPSAPLVC